MGLYPTMGELCVEDTGCRGQRDSRERPQLAHQSEGPFFNDTGSHVVLGVSSDTCVGNYCRPSCPEDMNNALYGIVSLWI